ncbi:heme exporter protein CcmD [Pantoea sp. Fr+CA_20]|uniref:heme exporter protein CcmD n=1 Tax=Pantoea TaxID=53335 RepID=UPI00211992DD|nr:heme exporter protein CcmD [Pantoea sp. Fr+CA_20]
MTPAFASWHDFFAMGGYAFYVWLAVLCTVLPMLGLALHALLSHRRLLADIRQRDARERRQRAARRQHASEPTGEEK